MANTGSNSKAPFRAGFLIHDASRLRRTVFDQRMKHMGITRSQWWVLSNLARDEGGGFAQIELARLLDVGKVALGGLIDRLEENGLVVRVADKEDRRFKRVQVSKKGKAIVAQLEAIAIEVNRDIMQGITADEEQTLIELLTRMKRNLKAMDAVPVSVSGRSKPGSDD